MAQVLNSKIGIPNETLDNVAALILANAATLNGGEHIAGLVLMKAVDELAKRYKQQPEIKNRHPDLFAALENVTDISDAKEIARCLKGVKSVAYKPQLPPNPFRPG